MAWPWIVTSAGSPGAPGDRINMLVLIIDGTKGRQDRCSRRAGGSRLASCLLLTAFRTRDHGKARSLGHRSGSGTILGHACERISDAYRGSPSGFPPTGYRGRERRTASVRSFPALLTYSIDIVIPDCKDTDSSAAPSRLSRAPISHWTAVRFAMDVPVGRHAA